MRILFVLSRVVIGGLERVTLNLVKELQNRGHDCAFALRKAYGELLPEAEALCQSMKSERRVYINLYQNSVA